MTLSTTTTRNDYTGNGTTATYSYTYRIFQDADLTLTAKEISSGAETTLTISTDYTVTGAGDASGGTIVLVDAAQAWLDASGFLDATYTLTIRRVVSETQATDIRNQGDFYPEVHEDEFDKLTMIDQQKTEELSRSWKMPVGIPPSDFDPTLPASILGKDRVLITTNAAGNGLIEGPSAVSGFTDTTAIHDNVSAEISAIAEKVTPIDADLIVIEDSASSNDKKRVQIGNLPKTDANAIHDNVASEISAVAEKVAPVSADMILIEDSADTNNKKMVQVGNLPAGTDANAIHDNVAAEISAVAEKVAPVSADMILIEDSADTNNKKMVQVGNLPAGTDANAIHDNVAAEISVVTEKATPVSADLLIIEDSADSNNKKRVQIGNLPASGGTDTDAVHVNVAAEISAIAEKVTPVSADLLIIEDSADTNNKKKLQIGNLSTTDATAIHDNVAAEISAVTEKVTPVDDDLIIIEDSADSNNKKRVRLANVGSAGEQNFYPNGNADKHTDLSNFSTGNNATFDGGGTLAGTFVLSSGVNDVIDGAKTFKLSGHATAGNNTNDYIASQTIDIPQGYRARTLAVKFQYKWSGTSGNVVWRVKDSTNGTILTDDSFTLETQNFLNAAREFTLSFYCPATCHQIEVGPQILTGESSVTLIWDEVVVNANPFVCKDLMEKQEVTLGDANGHGSSSTKIRIFDTVVRDNGPAILSYTYDSATLGAVFTALKKCHVTVSYTDSRSAGSSKLGISKNSSQLTTDIHSITKSDRMASAYGTTNYNTNIAWSGVLEIGDDIRPHGDGNCDATTIANFSITAIAESANVVHHDTGTENNYSARITSADVITSQSSPDNPAVASVTSGATGLYVITYTTSYFGVIPAARATAEVNGLNCSVTGESTSGCTVNIEDPSGTLTDADFTLSLTRQGTDYRNPSAYAITPITQTCILEDRKASGTTGGASSANTVHTRTLNTKTGDTDIVQLSSNRFILGAGKYTLTGYAPGHNVNQHQAFLYDVTNVAYIKDGMAARTPTPGHDGQTNAVVTHAWSIAAPTAYELRHWTSTARTYGLGVPVNGTGNPQSTEVYATVIITKTLTS